jgi:hypothetical protein
VFYHHLEQLRLKIKTVFLAFVIFFPIKPPPCGGIGGGWNACVVLRRGKGMEGGEYIRQDRQ